MTAPTRETAPRAGGLARAALTVAAITVVARVVGFVRILVFAHTVGPTCLGDTYYTANTVPNILFDIVAGGALTSVAVPLLAGPVDRGDSDAADQTSSALLTWCFLLLVPLMVIGAVASRPIMNALVGNGHPGCPAALEQSTGARMLLVFMPQVVLYGVGIVLTGVLQAHRRFGAPAVGPVISSLVVIGAYLLFATVASSRETSLSTLTRGHELILSVGTTLGVVALVAPCVLALRGTGRRWRPTLAFPHEAGPTARRLAIAGAVVIGSQDLATVAILRLANDRGADGAVVLFNLAWTVFLLPWAVLAVPIATAAFPDLTAAHHRRDAPAYAAISSRTTRVVVVGAAAAAATLVAAAEPVARVVVLGAPGSVPPTQLAHALVAFAPGLLGFGLVALWSRVLYARGDARTPALATAAGWALAVVVDLVLVLSLPRSQTPTALGAGTTVGMTLAAIWMLVTLRRVVPVLGEAGRTTGAAVGAGVLAALAGGAVARALGGFGVAGSVAEAALVAAVCLALYVAVLYRVDRSALVAFARRGHVR